jgi:hypothetical protein
MSRDASYVPTATEIQGDIPTVSIPNVAQTNRQVAMDNARNTIHDEIQEEAAAVRANYSPQEASPYIDQLTQIANTFSAFYDYHANALSQSANNPALPTPPTPPLSSLPTNLYPQPSININVNNTNQQPQNQMPVPPNPPQPAISTSSPTPVPSSSSSSSSSSSAPSIPPAESMSVASLVDHFEGQASADASMSSANNNHVLPPINTAPQPVSPAVQSSSGSVPSITSRRNGSIFASHSPNNEFSPNTMTNASTDFEARGESATQDRGESATADTSLAPSITDTRDTARAPTIDTRDTALAPTYSQGADTQVAESIAPTRDTTLAPTQSELLEDTYLAPAPSDLEDTYDHDSISNRNTDLMSSMSSSRRRGRPPLSEEVRQLRQLQRDEAKRVKLQMKFTKKKK